MRRRDPGLAWRGVSAASMLLLAAQPGDGGVEAFSQPEAPHSVSLKEAVERLSTPMRCAPWPGQTDPEKRVIRENPREAAALIRSMVRLPADSAGWDRLNSGEQTVAPSLALNLISLIGREHGDQLICEVFDEAMALYLEASACLRAMDLELVRSDPRWQEMSVRAYDAQHRALGIIGRTLSECRELRSPVLVDRMLDAYERRVDFSNNYFGVILAVGGQRGYVLDRIEALRDDPSIDRIVRYQIEQAFKAYELEVAKGVHDAPFLPLPMDGWHY